MLHYPPQADVVLLTYYNENKAFRKIYLTLIFLPVIRSYNNNKLYEFIDNSLKFAKKYIWKESCS